jgi:hypothetical protein
VAHLPHGEDLVGMGLAFIASGAVEEGYRTLCQALAGNSVRTATRRRAELELWRLMKRRGNLCDGIEMLRAMCRDTARSPHVDTFPFVELAKYYEHVEHNFDEAAELVEHAIRLLELRGQRAGHEELMHRLGRIRRKAFTP